MNTAFRNTTDWHELNGLPPRQGTRPPKPVDPDVAAEKEDSRLRYRERIKKALAESRIAEDRLAEINEVVERLENRKEQLAADHCETCRPIQAELELLRKQRIDRILAGDDDDSDERRRCELQEKIDAANAKLEQQIRDCDESLKPLLREQLAVAKQINPTLKTDLMHSASAENRMSLLVCRSRRDWIGHRVKSIRDAMNDRPFDTLLPHLLSDAEAMLADADRLCGDAVQACVDE